jgi:hypothetical protein
MVSSGYLNTSIRPGAWERLRRFLGLFLFSLSVLTVAGIAGLHRFMVAALAWVTP